MNDYPERLTEQQTIDKRETKRASYLHRTATTDYPCFRQDLGDSSGAGRVRLARLQYYDLTLKCPWQCMKPSNQLWSS